MTNRINKILNFVIACILKILLINKHLNFEF